MDRGARQTTVHGDGKSRTQLRDYHFLSTDSFLMKYKMRSSTVSKNRGVSVRDLR